MSDSMNCGKLEERNKLPKPDRTVDKPFCIQADDKYGMFRFVVRSVPDTTYRGDK